MRRTRLVLLTLMLLVPFRLTAVTSTYAVEVAVRSITGSSGPLTSGMRVDALFFRKGLDTNSPTTPQLLLVLRNVEVDSNSPSANKDGGHPGIARLLLTKDQAKSVRALPAAEVQLVVIPSPKPSRNWPVSGEVSTSSRTATGRGSGGQLVYADLPPTSQASEEEYGRFDPSKSVLGRILPYIIWPAVIFLMLVTFSGTIRGARRCRNIAVVKRRTALKVTE